MLRKIFILGLLCLSLPAFAQNKTLLVLGDSLSAGYGISLDRSWVGLLEKRLDESGHNYRVINKSISGETTLGAKVRIDNILSEIRPDVTIVELGGNDGLRGFTLNEIKTNLSEILDNLIASGSRVLLIPMKLPPNYGKAYNDRFYSIYEDLAREKSINQSRFILSGIATDPDLMQADGIHPEEEAQRLMLENVWPELETLL